MVKITLRLDKRYRLTNGNYPVKLVVARAGKTLYVPLNIDVSQEDWQADAKDPIKNRKDRKAMNTYIHTRLSQAEQTLLDLQAKGKLREITNKRLIEILSSDVSHIERTSYLSYYIEAYLPTIKNENTVEIYHNSLMALQKYCNVEKLLLSDMDSAWISNYVHYLQEDCHYKTNTVIRYVASIKKLYNIAYRAGHVILPFPSVKIEKPVTKKRSLYIEQLRALYHADLPPVKRKYRDVFFLIFFLLGINIGDLSRVKSVKNGRIEYIRSKTKKHYDVKIEPEAQEIIDKYKGKEHLLRFFDGRDRLYYRSFAISMKLSLRNTASKLGITEPLSSYWARHSWASIAVELDVPIETVSHALGHSIGSPTTDIYVRFNQKKIDEANRKVIDYLLHEKC